MPGRHHHKKIEVWYIRVLFQTNFLFPDTLHTKIMTIFAIWKFFIFLKKRGKISLRIQQKWNDLHVTSIISIPSRKSNFAHGQSSNIRIKHKFYSLCIKLLSPIKILMLRHVTHKNCEILDTSKISNFFGKNMQNQLTNPAEMK